MPTNLRVLRSSVKVHFANDSDGMMVASVIVIWRGEGGGGWGRGLLQRLSSLSQCGVPPRSLWCEQSLGPGDRGVSQKCSFWNYFHVSARIRHFLTGDDANIDANIDVNIFLRLGCVKTHSAYKDRETIEAYKQGGDRYLRTLPQLFGLGTSAIFEIMSNLFKLNAASRWIVRQSTLFQRASNHAGS